MEVKDFQELQKNAKECADYKRKLIRENNMLKKRIKELEELLIEFMEYVDNPCLSTVEEACMLLGHPIKDEKGCYCRLRRADEVEELRKIVEKEKRTRNKDCSKAFEKLEKIREILEE